MWTVGVSGSSHFDYIIGITICPGKRGIYFNFVMRSIACIITGWTPRPCDVFGGCHFYFPTLRFIADTILLAECVVPVTYTDVLFVVLLFVVLLEDLEEPLDDELEDPTFNSSEIVSLARS